MPETEKKKIEVAIITSEKEVVKQEAAKVSAKEDIYNITWAKNTDYGRNARVDYEVHHALTSSMEKTKRLTVLKKENLIIKGIIFIKMN